MCFAWNRSLISHDQVNRIAEERLMQAVSRDRPFLSANTSVNDLVSVSSKVELFITLFILQMMFKAIRCK